MGPQSLHEFCPTLPAATSLPQRNLGKRQQPNVRALQKGADAQIRIAASTASERTREIDKGAIGSGNFNEAWLAESGVGVWDTTLGAVRWKLPKP